MVVGNDDDKGVEYCWCCCGRMTMKEVGRRD